MTTSAGRIAVVGLVGGVAYGPDAAQALAGAGVVVGSTRHLGQVTVVATADAEEVELAGPLDAVLDTIAERRAAGASVCVLASGDPGFFGIVRVLGHRFGAESLVVHPAPSSISLAFARLGLAWDDADVVSVHGRDMAPALPAIARSPKTAILTSPENPPESLGKALLAAGVADRTVAVVSRLGEPGEAIARTDLAGLADGTFDPMSVVIITSTDAPIDAGPTQTRIGARPDETLGWGLTESAFEHRDSMITKAEVRAVALAKLALPTRGVLWDVGAGSGSVAIECARLSPGLEVLAVERDADQVARIEANAARHGVTVRVIAGPAPEALTDLPDPDRVFVGGGGIDVLDAARGRLVDGGVIVATYALLARAVEAEQRLGNLVQLSVSRGVPTGDLGVRLDAHNPVFLAWGTT